MELTPFEKTIAALPEPEMPAGLLERVTARIRREETWAIRRRWIFRSAALLAAAAFVAAIRVAYLNAWRSGFTEFVSLGATDPSAVAAAGYAYWLALLETAPAAGLAASAAALGGLLASLPGAFRQGHYHHLKTA